MFYWGVRQIDKLNVPSVFYVHRTKCGEYLSNVRSFVHVWKCRWKCCQQCKIDVLWKMYVQIEDHTISALADVQSFNFWTNSFITNTNVLKQFLKFWTHLKLIYFKICEFIYFNGEKIRMRWMNERIWHFSVITLVDIFSNFIDLFLFYLMCSRLTIETSA